MHEGVRDPHLRIFRLHRKRTEKILPRQPGTKEARYMHLFSGDIEDASVALAPSPANAVTEHDAGRLDGIEEEVRELRKEVADLKQQFATFRRQFE